MLEIKDRVRIASVSLIEHYEKSMEFYYKHINKSDIIKGEKRITFEEIPLIAYREAIANAIVHRNYFKRGNNRIEFFEDRIEIVSIGGLPIGISEKEFINGSFSNVRNRIIADIFYRLNLIEKLGTGIRRIKNAYFRYIEKPQFEVMENSTKITLPKISSLSNTNQSNTMRNTAKKLTYEEEKLFNFIRSSESVKRVVVEKYMGVRKTKAISMINRLIELKLITMVGVGKNVSYRVL
ncbi:MAG: ATP-binding protein [Alkaliphilus sp.]